MGIEQARLFSAGPLQCGNWESSSITDFHFACSIAELTRTTEDFKISNNAFINKIPGGITSHNLLVNFLLFFLYLVVIVLCCQLDVDIFAIYLFLLGFASCLIS